MARLPEQPRRSEIAPDEVAYYDAVVARRQLMEGVPPQPGVDHHIPRHYGYMMHSPRFCWALSHIGHIVASAPERPGSYSHHDREFVDQVLSADWKTNIILDTHIPDALPNGIRLEAIEALRAGREEQLTAEERLLATYIRQVVNGTVDDRTFNAMLDRQGVRGIVEYTMCITFFAQTLRLMQVFWQTEPSDDDVDLMIRDLKEGTRQPTPPGVARLRHN
jgi:hypothetical protein